MARTRGASHEFHLDDGVLLGKDGTPIPTGLPAALDRQGNYISPAAAHLVQPRNMPGHMVVQGPGTQASAPIPAIVGYRANAASWARNMEAWELARLLDMAFQNGDSLDDGLMVDVTPEQFNKMEGNLRRHFMPFREVPGEPMPIKRGPGRPRKLSEE